MEDKRHKYLYKAISCLHPYKNNPRKNVDAIQYVMESIRHFGFINPIVITADEEIVAGETRFEAAKRLNIQEVPCILVDNLTEEEVKAYRAADNKVSEFSVWDEKKLKEELESIQSIDMSAFGFVFPEEKEIEQEKPEVPFTEILREEHNYLVLYFDNDVDWLQAETLFNVQPVQSLSTRKDGKVSKTMRHVGVGRVLNGAKALEVLRREYQCQLPELPTPEG